MESPYFGRYVSSERGAFSACYIARVEIGIETGLLEKPRIEQRVEERAN